MAEKKTQRAWEQRLQSMQDDLEKREALLVVVEKKYSVMQVRVDEFLKRDNKLKAREEKVTEIEFKESGLSQLQSELQSMNTQAEKELNLQRKASSALHFKIHQFEKDMVRKESEVAQRLKAIEIRESKLVVEQKEIEDHFVSESSRLQEREVEVAFLENGIKLKTVQLSEEHSQLHRLHLDLKNKEEEHETYEKLMKEMQAADERSKRSLKWQEDELQRRLAELKIQREDQAAENAAMTALKARIEHDKRETERQLSSVAVEEAESERRKQRVNRQEIDVRKKNDRLDEEEKRLEELRVQLEAKDKSLAGEFNAVANRRRETEIDLKRATHLRLKSSVQETSNAAVSKKLQVKEKQLTEWDGELDWRETEFVRSVESAMNLSHEVPHFSPSHVNKAIVDLQMESMRQQYNTAGRRRVVSALQPQNRVGSAKSKKASSPLRGGRPASAATHSSSPAPLEHTIASTPNSRAPLAEREQRVMAQSHRIAMEERSVVLERDFRYLVGKVIRLQSTAATPEQREALMAQYFTANEQAVVQVALHRDRDLGAEIALRRIVSQCPIVDPVASTSEMVDRMKKWWEEMDKQLLARNEVILHDRVDQLEEAVEILRTKCPQFATNSSALPSRRSASAQPTRHKSSN